RGRPCHFVYEDQGGESEKEGDIQGIQAEQVTTADRSRDDRPRARLRLFPREPAAERVRSAARGKPGLARCRLGGSFGGSMTMIDSAVFRWGIALLAAALHVQFSHAQNPRLHDDRQINIASAEDVTKKRQQLIDFIFGPAGLAGGKLPVVEKNDTSPVRGLRALARVDTLTIVMEAD